MNAPEAMTPYCWAQSQLIAYFKKIIDKKDLSLVQKVLRDSLDNCTAPELRRKYFLLLGLTFAEMAIQNLPPLASLAAHEFWSGNALAFYEELAELRKTLKSI